jgi:predicted DNA-binding transcriptional regulator AlpA
VLATPSLLEALLISRDSKPRPRRGRPPHNPLRDIQAAVEAAAAATAAAATKPSEPPKTGPPEVKLLTRLEVCDFFKIKPVTLWEWVRDGRFPQPRTFGKEGSSRTCKRWLWADIVRHIEAAA